MKKTKKHNPRSEASQRQLVKEYTKTPNRFSYKPDFPIVKFFKYNENCGATLFAVFDLRDCYRKRAPLTGITKKFKKVIQPKRSKKK